jgi:hypothetical protein
VHALAWLSFGVGVLLLAAFLFSHTRFSAELLDRIRPWAGNPVLGVVSLLFVGIGGFDLSQPATGILPCSVASPQASSKGVIMITLSGTVSVQNNVAVLTPNPGQSINTPVPLMMQNLPQFGSDQDHINAAVQQFSSMAGPVTVTGSLRVVGDLQFLSVQVLVSAGTA